MKKLIQIRIVCDMEDKIPAILSGMIAHVAVGWDHGRVRTRFTDNSAEWKLENKEITESEVSEFLLDKP
jgi:hypothetical protein